MGYGHGLGLGVGVRYHVSAAVTPGEPLTDDPGEPLTDALGEPLTDSWLLPFVGWLALAATALSTLACAQPVL